MNFKLSMQIPLKEKEGDTYRVILRTHERNLFKKFTTLFRLNKCQKIYPRLRNQIHHKVCKVCQKNTHTKWCLLKTCKVGATGKNLSLTVRGLRSSWQRLWRLLRLNLSVGPSGLWFDNLYHCSRWSWLFGVWRHTTHDAVGWKRGCSCARRPSEVLLKKYMTIVWLFWLLVQLVAGFSHFPPTNLRSSLSSHVMGSRQQCWWTFALGEFLCKHTSRHTWGGYYCDFKPGNKWGIFLYNPLRSFFSSIGS